MEPIELPSVITGIEQALAFGRVISNPDENFYDHFRSLERQTIFMMLANLVLDETKGIRSVGLDFDDSDPDGSIFINYWLADDEDEDPICASEDDELVGDVWGVIFSCMPNSHHENFINAMIEPMTADTVWSRAKEVLPAPVAAAMQAAYMGKDIPAATAPKRRRAP